MSKVATVPKPVKNAPTLITLPATLESALHAMNEEFCIIDALPAVAVIPTLADPELRIHSRAEVTQLICSSRKAEGIPVAPAWFSWPKQRRVKSLTYAPGKPRFFDNKLNSWVPSPITPKKGDITLWTRYIDHIFSSDPTNRAWFMAWMAYQFQHPGVKLHSAVVFWSPETSTGKSLFGYMMAELFGQHNFAEINEAELHGRFNFWANCKQFVMGEEIKGSGSERQADFIKTLITRRHVNIDTKNTKQYTLPDCINYFFTSNRGEAFHLDPTDRRFFVHRLGTKKLEAHYVHHTLLPWFRSEGAPAVLYHLLNEIDLSAPVLDGLPFNPFGQAAQTDARQAMIDASRDESEVWLDDFKDGHLPGYALASAEDLYNLFLTVHKRSKVGPKAFANSCAKRFRRAYSGNALKCSDGQRRRLFICDVSHDPKRDAMTGPELVTQYESEITHRIV